MCDPVTAAIVVAATSVVGTTANVIAQSKAAKAQARAINEQAAVTQQENRLAASSQMFDDMRAARREQGRIRAAAGEAGLSLSSGAVEGILMDSQMQLGLKNDRTLANLESRQMATNAEANSMMSQVQKPTLLGAGLQIGSAAASGFAGIQNAKIMKKGGGS